MMNMQNRLLSVEGVSKKYCRSLRRSIRYLAADLARELVGRKVNRLGLREGEFLVFDGINVALERGQCLGVVGPNGAGKSTLLKLLTGVIRPDAGVIRVNGRTGSLIELGAGIHPMLTGRENIDLLASLSGLSAAQIRRRLDWIVDFSGLEAFLDTPVRSYSSGMIARLGFSVASAIEPDILLVDEVLSVGDLAFQSKCMGRVSELMENGTGVVFVSHQMNVIDKMCSEVMLLQRGRPALLGEPGEIIAAYRESMLETGRSHQRIDHPALAIRSVTVSPVSGEGIHPGGDLLIAVDYECLEPLAGYLGIAIHHGYGEQIAACRTDRDGQGLVSFDPGHGTFKMRIARLPLAAGNYSVSVRLYGQSGIGALVNHQAYYPFIVEGGADVVGIVQLEHAWEITQ